MPTFIYEAINASGQPVSDKIEAESTEDAMGKIRGLGHFPTRIQPVAGAGEVSIRKIARIVRDRAMVEDADGPSGHGLRDGDQGKESGETATPRPFDIAEPPRRVPLLLRGQVMVCSGAGVWAWVVMGFAMLFVWQLALHADVASWYVLRGPLTRVQGTLTASTKTGFAEGGGKGRPGKPVYAHAYEFCDSAGVNWSGVSYSLVASPPRSPTIEYPPDDPAASRIAGMRRKPFGAGVAFIGLLPAAVLVWIMLAMRKGRRACRLLEDGKPAYARLTSSRPTGTKVNKQPVYAMTFSFKSDDGQMCETCIKTHVTGPLTDDRHERLLYLPADPRQAVLLDGLPGRPVIDEIGMLRVRSPASAVVAILIPLAVLVGHGGYAMMKLFGLPQ